MGYYSEALTQAWDMISRMDPDVFSAVQVSLVVSLNATLLASVLGIPLGFLLGSKPFRGRDAISALLHTLTAVPTVVVGLFAYSLLTSQGVFGDFHLLYTSTGIVIGEFILLLPLVTVLAMSATQGISTEIRETALTLGATGFQAAVTVIREGRFAYLTAIAACFGRAIGEVGVAMMLGGNIKGFTRTMTTALALETEKGEFAVSLALGLLLLIIALIVNAMLHAVKSRAERI